MSDPLCNAKTDSPECRCDEYARVRLDERRRLRRLAEQAYIQATPKRQGRMTAEQKAKVAAAHDFLIFITKEMP